MASSVTRVSMEVETVDADKAGKNNLDIKESTPEMSFDDKLFRNMCFNFTVQILDQLYVQIVYTAVSLSINLLAFDIRKGQIPTC